MVKSTSCITIDFMNMSQLTERTFTPSESLSSLSLFLSLARGQCRPGKFWHRRSFRQKFLLRSLIMPRLSVEWMKMCIRDRALKGIYLQVNAGEHIAILGRTGCGKSTLLQLLTRAWDPQQGEILLNDSPIASLNEAALRQTISVVPQRVHLFSATLRDNLLLASPGSSDEALAEILRRVGLEKLLEDAGLNSWLGEGGRQLSGGELRRLAKMCIRDSCTHLR